VVNANKKQPLLAACLKLYYNTTVTTMLKKGVHRHATANQRPALG